MLADAIWKKLRVVSDRSYARGYEDGVADTMRAWKAEEEREDDAADMARELGLEQETP